MSMYYPQLEDTEKDSSFIRAFNGLNHTEVIDESMFYDMENCTTDKFPLLTRRKLRMASTEVRDKGAVAIGAMNGLAWTTPDGESNTKFYYKNHYWISNNYAFSGEVKQLVQFGAYIIAFPQGRTFNTEEAIPNIGSMPIKPIGLKTVDVKIYGHWNNRRESGEYVGDSNVQTGTSEPVSPSENTYWRDTNYDPPKMKQWSRSQQMWADVDMYVEIGFYKEASADDDAFMGEFRDGDTIKISGMVDYEETVEGVTRVSPWSKLNGTHVIQKVISNRNAVIDGVNCRYLLIRVICPYFFWDKGPDNIHITLEREMPEMDFVCANGGHLFGCSNANHEIYVSSNADPFNWNVFEGTANDSYAEVVGTPGDFTGCIAYRDSVLFFKEDRIHILYGKRPSAYQLDELECVGLQKGCHNTLAIANETLFYKGKYGVYAYSGGLPELISDALGDYNKLTMTAGGSDGQKYYISGGGYVFSYDPRRGLWAKEDNREIVQFASNGLDLYGLEIVPGVQNILQTTAESTTVNGVAFTVNSDGSVTVDTGDTPPEQAASFRVYEGSAMTQAMRLSGCPSGGSNTSFDLRVYNGTQYLYDYGNGQDIPDGFGVTRVVIVVRAGQEMHNVVFRPSLVPVKTTSICAMDNYPDIAAETGLTFASESNGLEWSATSGWIGLDSPDEKYISRLRLRLEIPLGSVFIVETAYDNSDDFTEVERVNGDGLRPVFINILPRRCDVMRLRFRGIGDFKLYSIAKQYEQGSDSY